MALALWIFLAVAKTIFAGEPCLEGDADMLCSASERTLLATKQSRGSVDTMQASKAVADEFLEGSAAAVASGEGTWPTQVIPYKLPKKYLLSYWDEGKCGPISDDYQAGVCGWRDVEQQCPEKKTKPTTLCSDGVMEVESKHGNGKMGSYKEGGCPFAYKVQFKCNPGKEAEVVYFGTFTKEVRKLCVVPHYNGKYYSGGIADLDCKRGNKLEVLGGEAPASLELKVNGATLCAELTVATRFPLHMVCHRQPTKAPTPNPTPAWAGPWCKKGNKDERCLSGCRFATGWFGEPHITRDFQINSDCIARQFGGKKMTWHTGDNWVLCGVISAKGYCYFED